MSLGRLVRYCILAYLGAVYGRKIFAVVLAHGEVALYVTIGVVVVVTAIMLLMRYRRKREALAGRRLADELLARNESVPRRAS